MPDIFSCDVEDLYADSVGFTHVLHTPLLRTALKHNAFVAGGLARKLLADGMADDTYWADGGDIDLFFRSEEDYLATLSELSDFIAQNSRYSRQSARSLAGFATDIYVDPSHVVGTFMPRLIKVQLVDFHFGTPEEIIGSFDLVNSMVGFDMYHGWVADGWRELQRKKTVDVSRVNERANMLGARIAKYVTRYGYTSVTPRTEKHLAEWYSSKIEAHASDKIRKSHIDKTKDGLWFNPHHAFKPLAEHLKLEDETILAMVGSDVVKVRAPSYLSSNPNVPQYLYVDAAMYTLEGRGRADLLDDCLDRLEQLAELKNAKKR